VASIVVAVPALLIAAVFAYGMSPTLGDNQAGRVITDSANYVFTALVGSRLQRIARGDPAAVSSRLRSPAPKASIQPIS
jgi:hypothetical protein